MKIREIFEREIERHIPSVVKAEDRDEGRVWQELDEFVVTKELRQHFDQLAQALKPVLPGEEDDRKDKNGIWITGFFGSGKSHLLKILAYLLENEVHENGRQKKSAIDFFESKLTDDAMLFADLKVAAEGDHSTILFNIDNRAETNIENSQEMMLKVFFGALNEKQGFCSRHLNVARVERHLSEKGLLDKFVDELKKRDVDWTDRDLRDEYDFYRGDIEAALAEVLNESLDSAGKILDEEPPVSVEELCKWVKAYLKTKGPRHHINFLIDEVGQFIGKDGHRMLNLQTITEQLGSQCKGRARIVVTAQEDLDSILGEISSTDEFSKIQGRFRTKLSMSSSNVDEVVQQRVLKKSASGETAVSEFLSSKVDVLDSQLSFTDCRYTFPRSTDLEEHVQVYPIPAYQFELMQKVFEAIRKSGFAGKHLAQGERTVVGSCHQAVQQISGNDLGDLVPFHFHYETVQQGIDTHVKSTIQKASENEDLEPQDVVILKLLFLIRYVDEMPGNLDNLVTLSMDQVDMDRKALRDSIEKSLNRLERQSLINVNAGRYYFLTDEEQDVNRKIKAERVESQALVKMAGDIFFEDILAGSNKVTNTGLHREFSFERFVDSIPYGRTSSSEISVYLAPPIGNDYEQYAIEGREIATASRKGCLFVCMQDQGDLFVEMERFLKVEKYIKGSNRDESGESLNRILRDKNQENRDRRKRILEEWKSEIEKSRLVYEGRVVRNGGITNPKDAINEALTQEIRNDFNKMLWIDPPHRDPERELRALLSGDPEASLSGMSDEFPHPQAVEDLQLQIQLHDREGKTFKVSELLDKISKKPYGWPDGDVLILLAHLYRANKIEFHFQNHPITGVDLRNKMLTPRERGDLVLKPRTAASGETIRKASDLLYEWSGKRPDDAESPLAKECHQWLRDRATQTENMTRSILDHHPGSESARQIAALYRDLASGNPDAPATFLQQFVEKTAELQDANDDFDDLQTFQTQQKPAWDTAYKYKDVVDKNSQDLQSHKEAWNAYQRICEIFDMPEPYRCIHELTPLTETVKAALDAILDEARTEALGVIDAQEKQVLDFMHSQGADQQSSESGIRKDFDAFRTVANEAKIKDRIDAQKNRAAEMADQWIAKLSVSSEQVQESPGSPSENPPAPTPSVETVRPAELSGEIIRDEEQLEAYLQKIRDKVLAILDQGGQARIR